MAKGRFASFMPLYSIGAWKRFYGVYPFGYWYPYPVGAYGYAIYQRRRTWHGVMCIKERYYTPYNPRAPVQQAHRQNIADGNSHWKSLTYEQKDYYNKLKSPEAMTGFDRFMHYYLVAEYFKIMWIRENKTIKKRDSGDSIWLGDDVNALEIRPDGEIILHGTARVTRHYLIDPKRFKMPAANFPAESFEGLFYTLDFDKNTEESAYCQEHIPFRWAEDTDIEVVVDWLHDSVDDGKVVWGIEYKSIGSGEVVVGAGTEITQVSAGSHVAGKLVRTVFTTKILGSALAEEDCLAFRLFRKAADGEDTLNEDARVINIHFHFTQDKLGQAT